MWNNHPPSPYGHVTFNSLPLSFWALSNDWCSLLLSKKSNKPPLPHKKKFLQLSQAINDDTILMCIINHCLCWSNLYLFLLSSESDCFLCILTFVLVYYFSMAGAVWFVILAFSWSICFKSLGSTRDNFAGKVVYFHIIAWTYPLTLAISVLALKQVIWHSLNPWT